jgi:hypothetical protein
MEDTQFLFYACTKTPRRNSPAHADRSGADSAISIYDLQFLSSHLIFSHEGAVAISIL